MCQQQKVYFCVWTGQEFSTQLSIHFIFFPSWGGKKMILYQTGAHNPAVPEERSYPKGRTHFDLLMLSCFPLVCISSRCQSLGSSEIHSISWSSASHSNTLKHVLLQELIRLSRTCSCQSAAQVLFGGAKIIILLALYSVPFSALK